MFSDMNVFSILANMIYLALGLIALWGAFCFVMVWSRVSQKRFRNEQEQVDFLTAVEQPLLKGDFGSAIKLCEGDRRAIPQLVHLGLENHKIGFVRIRQLLLDRFQRDVLADLEFRLSWVNTVIKSAPMVGLLGTVVGMMGAFETLATAENVQADQLAGDISVALVTTACGLAIAIPLVLCTASINVRIGKLEYLVEAGMTRYLDTLRGVLAGKK